MTWAIAAISVSEQIEKYGAYAGLAAIVGLGVLSLLYFAQAREVKRLREWAGRAPERAAELEARVSAEAALRTSGAPLRPQTAAGQAATSATPAPPAATGTPAAAGTPAAPGTPSAPAPAPAGAKPTEEETKPAAPVPGLPVAVPAASGAPAAGASPAPAAAGPASAPAPDAPAKEEPAGDGAGASNGAPPAPAAPAGPRVPGRPPPGSTVTPPPVTAAGAAGPPPADEATTVRPLRGGPPSRTLPPPETAGGHRTPSRRTLGVIGGALAVVAAVAIVLVLTLGGEEAPPPPNQVAETTAATTPSEPGRTQSSRQARIDRADTPVAVLNGTGVNGLARQVADRLQSTGYQAAVDNTQARPATVIGFKEGAEPAAREIGRLLEVPSGQIQPMPSDLTPVAGDNAVVVVIGADKASD